MNDNQKNILQQIINCESTQEKIFLMNANRQLMENMQIILFDEDASNFRSFEDKTFGKYYLCGIADYNRCWVIDNWSVNMQIKVFRKVYFDINIISRIDQYLRGSNIEDESDLIDLLRHIKENQYELEIGNSIIERMSKSYNEKMFRQSMESFYEYKDIKHIGERLPTGFQASDGFIDFYERCKRVGQMSQDNIIIRQYNFLLCLFIKAILVKADKTIKNKVDELVRFSLNELKCLMINELYLLCLYIKSDKQVKKTFAKFHSNIKDGIEKAVRNSVWDIYHARIIEQDMQLYETSTHSMELPFFATNDKGVKEYWNVNPRKMVVLDHGTAFNVYSHNINDIKPLIQDSSLLIQMTDVSLASKREKEIHYVDIEKILNGLLSELDKVVI